MVRDYVRKLYAPAARDRPRAQRRLPGRRRARGLEEAGPRRLAGVRVEHVESSGVGDAPEIGTTLTVRAFVSLGELVARRRRRAARARRHQQRGRAGRHRRSSRSSLAEGYEGGRHRFDGDRACSTSSGAFGYTVRVVPQQRPARLARRARRRRAPLTAVTRDRQRLSRSRTRQAAAPPDGRGLSVRLRRIDDDRSGAPRRERVAGLDRGAVRWAGVGGEHDLAGLHPLVVGQRHVDRRRRRR